MKKIITILFCISVAFLVLAGCTGGAITFNRDSSVSDFMDSLQTQNNKPVVKRTSGLVIYSDQNAGSSSQKQSGSSLSPDGVSFDLPMKF